MTPWVPIGLTLLATVGAAYLVWRLTRDGALAVSAALLALALASFALGVIATIAFVWGGILLFGSLVAFVISRLGWGARASLAKGDEARRRDRTDPSHDRHSTGDAGANRRP